MEKIIWVIGNNRKEMIEAQRSINSTGSMRAVCLLSFEAVKRAVPEDTVLELSRFTSPSLIIMDYNMSLVEDFTTLSFLKRQKALAGVPLFFMSAERTAEIDEDCYSKGATVVLHKPFSSSGILRIERTAWQHEVTKNYEKMLQKQASDLQAAKEIHRLNDQLKARNELLYQIFGRYFSDKILDVILEHPEGAAIGGEKREVTVMMTDLMGFTSLSERLDSDSLTDLLNYYFGKMAEVVNQYRGTIIEFLGDAILIVFGAPLVSDTATEDAIAAAITMQNKMGEVNEYCVNCGYPMLEMGIGIHRGDVFIGNVGSETMMRYNVIGRAVNECSRIESYCVGGQILASVQAISGVKCNVQTQNKMEMHAKGVEKPIQISEVTGIGGTYQCFIENVAFDVMMGCEEGVIFNLYLVEEKKVSEMAITTILQSFSYKRAIVNCQMDDIDINEYSDVEIFAATDKGRAVFTGVYAKVIEIKDNLITLHFTHTNGSFERFADGLLMERFADGE